jgi:hypothetical protein
MQLNFEMEKRTMRTILKIVLVAATLLSLGNAQEAHPLPRHPGDVIKYRIVFDGPNADKIKTVTAQMVTNSIPKDQAGFTNGFGTDRQFTPSSPKTFDIEMTIPKNIATGDYRLQRIDARADEGSAMYADQDYSVPIIHVENPRTFTPPTIKVAPLP